MLHKKTCLLFFGVFWFAVSNLSAQQEQRIADSLALIYQQDPLSDSAKMGLLVDLSYNEMRDLKKGLAYAEELIQLAEKTGSKKYQRMGYLLKGNAKKALGELDKALEAYIKSAEIARQDEYLKGETEAFITIADTYSAANNPENAMTYYNQAITNLRRSKDSGNLASALSNAGDEFRKMKNYDSALVYLREAKNIFDKINNEGLEGYCLGNMGMVYASIGKDKLAEQNINEAIRILEEAQDYHPICDYLLSMADVYLSKGDEHTALTYATKSLRLAEQYKLREQSRDASHKLWELYEKTGNTAEAFGYYKKYIAYRDSLDNLDVLRKMGDIQRRYEVSQKQRELDRAKEEKQAQQRLVIALFVILNLAIVLSGTLYWFYKAIAREKSKSENLLLNILPAETAQELKQNGKVEVVKFDEVTILFTDFVEFSKLAEHVAPELLVKSVDAYFKKFDEITTKYGLEKIKTIGDSYMCACGLPTANPSHARNVILAAKEMMEVVETRLQEKDGMSHFNIRMGIHSGPVVAGIVGIKKWQYDIWGDTVNVASRMESMSKPGRINLSETTWLQVKDEFPCEYRGEIEVKNRGLLKMYFLS